MTFRSYYLFWSIILFLTEVYIAIDIRDNFIRPYVGDVLVVILIYAIVRTFFKVPILTTAIGVLLFSFAVEILQYFEIVKILGLENSSLARTVIGTTFVVKDLIAYTIGIIMLLLLEKLLGRYKQECKFYQ